MKSAPLTSAGRGWNRRAGRLLAVAAMAMAAFTGVAVAAAAPAAAAPGKFQLVGKGADSCAAPSTSQMSAFFNNTPYSAWGVYIGGEDRSCSQPNLTAGWVTTVTKQGWHLLPIWVGPQNPCASGFDHFSTSTTTAYSQGVAQAKSAYTALHALGMADNSPVIYDLEAPGSSTSTCINATKAFIRGWTVQLHVAPAQSAGVYTSTCGGFIDDFASNSPPPDFIDGADWDGATSVRTMACVSSSHWTQHQRHKQYQGGHNVTENGVTLNVDSDCSNGPTVALAAFNGNSACL
jgi:hypothetical protein